jgi:hypothetical protein
MRVESSVRPRPSPSRPQCPEVQGRIRSSARAEHPWDRYSDGPRQDRRSLRGKFLATFSLLPFEARRDRAVAFLAQARVRVPPGYTDRTVKVSPFDLAHAGRGSPPGSVFLQNKCFDYRVLRRPGGGSIGAASLVRARLRHSAAHRFWSLLNCSSAMPRATSRRPRRPTTMLLHEEAASSA